MDRYTEFAHYTLIQEVLVITLKVEYLSMHASRHLIYDRVQILRERSRPVLIDIRNLKRVQRGVIRHAQTKEAVNGMKALAILTGSLFTMLMANFYLQWSFCKDQSIRPPGIASRDEGKALHWLGQYSNIEKMETVNYI